MIFICSKLYTLILQLLNEISNKLPYDNISVISSLQFIFTIVAYLNTGNIVNLPNISNLPITTH